MTAPEPSPNPPKLVLCAAFPPELEALRRELAGEPVEFRVLGVGLVDSALGAASALVAGRPALLVGTVGAYPSSGLAIGALVTAGSLALAADPAELPDMLAGALTAIPVDGFPQGGPGGDDPRRHGRRRAWSAARRPAWNPGGYAVAPYWLPCLKAFVSGVFMT